MVSPTIPGLELHNQLLTLSFEFGIVKTHINLSALFRIKKSCAHISHYLLHLCLLTSREHPNVQFVPLMINWTQEELHNLLATLHMEKMGISVSSLTSVFVHAIQYAACASRDISYRHAVCSWSCNKASYFWTTFGWFFQVQHSLEYMSVQYERSGGGTIDWECNRVLFSKGLGRAMVVAQAPPVL